MRHVVNLFSMLRDTKFVLALVGLVVVCTTVLVALDQVEFVDAVTALGSLLTGVGISWLRGAAPAEPSE